jgi:hypothetical protein
LNKLALAQLVERRFVVGNIEHRWSLVQFQKAREFYFFFFFLNHL